MGKAEEIYKMWHLKEPDGSYTKKVKALDLDNKMVSLGTGYSIGYTSAKWEKEYHDYIHHFKNPSVYLPQGMVAKEDAVGKPRKVGTLVGARSPKKQMEVTFLGAVLDLHYRDADGKMWEVSGVRGAELLSTQDKKAIIILAKKCPIIVRGGSMRVTARGIVD